MLVSHPHPPHLPSSPSLPSPPLPFPPPDTASPLPPPLILWTWTHPFSFQMINLGGDIRERETKLHSLTWKISSNISRSWKWVFLPDETAPPVKSELTFNEARALFFFDEICDMFRKVTFHATPKVNVIVADTAFSTFCRIVARLLPQSDKTSKM